MNRQCPNCKGGRLKIPLLGGDFICRECVSVFIPKKGYKFVLSLVASIIFLISLWIFAIYSDTSIGGAWLLGIILEVFVLPVIVIVVYWFNVPLVLGGVKGAVLRRRS